MAETLQGTPWWVYLIFIYIILVGIRARKPRVISTGRLLIIPGVIFAFSFALVLKNFRDAEGLWTWFLSLIPGMFIGYLTVRKWVIHADRKKNLISLPGSAFTLVLLLLFFVKRYFFGYLYSVDPIAQEDIIWTMINLISSGIISGIFIGRSGILFYRFCNTPHKPLSKK